MCNFMWDEVVLCGMRCLRYVEWGCLVMGMRCLVM